MHISRTTKMAVAALLSLGLLFVAAGTAFAHASVIDSDPKMGSTITQAPTTITVTTAENMKPGSQNSNLFVYGPSGALVSQGVGSIPLNNPKQMSIKITPEKNPGVYIVRWITVSADDGDPDQGAFIFTVNPAGAATATVVPKSTAPAATQAPPASTGGTPAWMSILTGVLGLIVGLGAGVAIMNRRRSIPAAPAVSEEQETETSKSS
ncbi:MAG TPA: copper resistance protein CopC [Ktedonosporobacter sp.]|nr:copper resistance protein CopC [Ktedonosporobacter sp.]